MSKYVSEAEISERLKKVSVSTIFGESRKVSVSKQPNLESRKSLSLDRFGHTQSQRVSVSKKQKIWVSKKSQSGQFPLTVLEITKFRKTKSRGELPCGS